MKSAETSQTFEKFSQQKFHLHRQIIMKCFRIDSFLLEKKSEKVILPIDRKLLEILPWKSFKMSQSFLLASSSGLLTLYLQNCFHRPKLNRVAARNHPKGLAWGNQFIL